MAARQLLNLTATLGPFGLAFPAEPLAVQRLSCDQVRGRPFVTGMQVHRLVAPIGARDAYEFRVTCGSASTPWTELGPPLLVWSSSITAEGNCPRPQSASGLMVTRAREEASPWLSWWRGGGHDRYAFGLLCGEQRSSVGLLDTRGSVEEQRSAVCPGESFVSALVVSRGYEPQGSYDLYEFALECSEMVDAAELGAQRAAASRSLGGGGFNAGASVEPELAGESGARPVRGPPGRGGAADGGDEQPTASAGRNVPAGMAGRRGAPAARGSPLVGSRGAGEEPSASGRRAEQGAKAAGASTAPRTSQEAPADASAARAARDARRTQEEMANMAALLKHRREHQAQADDADAASVFGRVRSTADDSARSVASKHGGGLASGGPGVEEAEEVEGGEAAGGAGAGSGGGDATGYTAGASGREEAAPEGDFAAPATEAASAVEERLDAVQERIRKLAQESASEGGASSEGEAEGAEASASGAAASADPRVDSPLDEAPAGAASAAGEEEEELEVGDDEEGIDLDEV